MSKLLVISGAGTGVESGIRAFRVDTESGKSLWGEYDIEEVCDYDKFVNDPEIYKKANEFYNKLRVELGTVQPNKFHKAVAELYMLSPENVLNITTNVDDLLERAGIDSKYIMHVHGILTEIYYNLGEEFGLKDVGYSEVDISSYDRVKPNVVFFGEIAPLYYDMYNMIGELESGDHIVIVGCSSQVVDFLELASAFQHKGIKIHYVDPFISDENESFCEKFGIKHYNMTATEFVETEQFKSFKEIL